MLLILFGRSIIKIQYSSFTLFPVAYPFLHNNVLQYYIKREKCKVNDVIFPSGCEARTIKLGNKNMKIGIYSCATSVRSKNIFTDISRYPTGNHEINDNTYHHLTSSSPSLRIMGKEGMTSRIQRSFSLRCSFQISP